MRISIFGLGYVGSVTAACLARDGHEVVGVDTNPAKVQLVNSGQTPVVEPGLGELLGAGVAKRMLRATTHSGEAVASTEMSIICVGTPSRKNGDLNVAAVKEVSEQIGSAIGRKERGHIVVMRSTVLPGTTRQIVLPTLEQTSGYKAGADFGLAYNPEFLREATAIDDFDNPPKTVIGALDALAASKTADLYRRLQAPLLLTSIETSEIVKYVDNVWHALKVCFGNEIGNICKASGVDSHAVMDIFFKDTKLNISPHYLKPGFAFGGSCLPKDTQALNYRARQLDLNLPLLSSISESNRVQIERAVDFIIGKGHRRIAVLGFSFKAGTDDLRDSPLVQLIERLIGKGYDLRLYDRSVNLAALTGANKHYIRKLIPHINSLMVETMEEALAHGELVVVGNNAPEFARVPALLDENQVLVDFVRLPGTSHLKERYDGINW